MTKKFIRRDSNRYSKIGKNRPKLQKWRKPKGRDNKMREKRKSYPSVVSVGYKTQKSQANQINEKTPLLIINPKDLKQATKENILILAKRLGAKKKIEIIKQAQEKNLQILNLKGGKQK